MKKQEVVLTVNGRKHELYVEPNLTLLDVLRDNLHYYDVKSGCEKGNCGACTVLLDGAAVNSCLVLVGQAHGHEVTTVAGLGSADDPHPLQQAFAELGAAQCGFCIPGMIVSAAGLLEENPAPNIEEIRDALTGNICRCTGYKKQIEAIEQAAREIAANREVQA